MISFATDYGEYISLLSYSDLSLFCSDSKFGLVAIKGFCFGLFLDSERCLDHLAIFNKL